MKKAILIQARMSSSRFPGKMLSLIKGKHLINFVFERCKKSRNADIVAVLTSTDNSDDCLFNHCLSSGFPVFRGSLNNVLERYINAAKFFNADLICRVCGDSPFVDYCMIDNMFFALEQDGLDYISLSPKSCIPGFISEVISIKALEKAYANFRSEKDLEHVTSFIRDNPDNFKLSFIDSGLTTEQMLDLKLTVDLPEDLKICNKVTKFLEDDFSSRDVIIALEKNLENINNNVY